MKNLEWKNLHMKNSWNITKRFWRSRVCLPYDYHTSIYINASLDVPYSGHMTTLLKVKLARCNWAEEGMKVFWQLIKE